ncbi:MULTISPECIES: acyl carrier protein [unclassified Leeuwenhoekiella]|uniref:acyl carrier protein n=1 Tax=unclassified Leeuwenhoekiella TaxID=2615029 RepID=UPI00048C53E8|nr:phosphopantetheine-binding protein [Leeuwenhoekiella sp. MAR_2009_132]
MNQEIYEKLTQIIKPYLPEDVEASSISEDSHLVSDLNINSTHLVDIVLDVEDAFDITIEDDELDKMETVKASITLIEQKLAAK